MEHGAESRERRACGENAKTMFYNILFDFDSEYYYGLMIINNNSSFYVKVQI